MNRVLPENAMSQPIPMLFESDLERYSDDPRFQTYDWWLAKRFIKSIYGKRCLKCSGPETREFDVFVVQITGRLAKGFAPKIADLQTLCRIHARKYRQVDLRPEGWEQLIKRWRNCLFRPTKFPEDLYWPLPLSVTQGLSSTPSLDSVKREYRLAQGIAQNHHRFISKWCKGMDWLERDKRYSAYYAQMKATQEALELKTKYCESSIEHFYAAADDTGVRTYFVEELGKYSKTSLSYFLVKDYFENEYR